MICVVIDDNSSDEELEGVKIKEDDLVREDHCSDEYYH